MGAPKKRELSAEEPSSKRQKRTEDVEPKSILKPEEKIFPRGGASVLTPQEIKQVHLQAKQDVLFEQGLTSKRTKSDEHDSNDAIAESGQTKSKKSKKDKKDKKDGGKKSKKDDKSKERKDDSDIKPESLGFKRLVEGSMLLGQITEITRQDVCLALPNNLFGYVPLSSVSDQFSAKIEKALASDDESEAGSDSEDDEATLLRLDQHFRIGQTLRAYVTSTEAGDGVLTGKSKRHIELSVEPKLANQELKKSDLHVGCIVQAAVDSVEDHGLVMDLGIEDSTAKAFLPVGDLEQGVSIQQLHRGAVLLCQITKLSKDGAAIKLTANHTRGGDVSKLKYVTSAPSIKSILPGTPVELLVTDTSDKGVVGKIMGMVDATADFIHSGGATDGVEIEEKYSIGQRVKARVVCTFPNSEPSRVGVSLLPHVLSLQSTSAPFKHSEFVEGTIAFRPLKAGIFLKYDGQSIPGFVHVSRVHDKKIAVLSSESAYQAGSKHRCRVIGFNPIDRLVIAAMDEKTLSEPFLTISDVPTGAVVNGKIIKFLVSGSKVSGLLVELADGIVGFVPEMHFADVQLTQPEKRFREGMSIRAVVLAVNVFRRRIRLSLKKSLVNSDAAKFTDLASIEPGAQSPGTLIKVFANGAIVKFFGSVRGFLPVAEMSEGYVPDARQHFRPGQVVNVHVIRVDPAEKQLIVSCRDPAAFGAGKSGAFDQLSIGDIVSGTITELAPDGLVIQLGDAAVKALLDVSHLTDLSVKRNASVLKKLRVGQTLAEMVVLQKNGRRNTATVSLKPSLIEAGRTGKLVSSATDLVERTSLPGFIRAVTTDGLFVQFGGPLVGLVHRSQLPEGAIKEANFGFFPGQSVSPLVLTVSEQGKIQLSLRPGDAPDSQSAGDDGSIKPVVNPVDPSVKKITDLSLGSVIRVSVSSIKQSQLNVRIAEGIQGRIDVSEAFAADAEIADRSAPLTAFSKGEVVSARVIGIHDARTHRFLPISNRSAAKSAVLELSIRAVADESTTITKLGSVTVGSVHRVAINNYGRTNVWVNLSAGVRGSIDLLRLSDDVSRLARPSDYFPVGSIVDATVVHVDQAASRVDLAVTAAPPESVSDVTSGSLYVGRVAKVGPDVLIIKLSNSLFGLVPRTELADDFETATASSFEKDDIVRVSVVEARPDASRLILSVRPSLVLSSQMAVVDKRVTCAADLTAGQIIRGFVGSVSPKGISINLGPSVSGFVRLAELSDRFLKEGEWDGLFKVGQLVRARVLVADSVSGRVELSTKESVLQDGYVSPITFDSVSVGDVFAARVRKVESFGVFVLVEQSKNVSGLCHKSMLADGAVEDVTALYSEGDRVKVKVVSVDKEKRRLNFGLKASLFTDADMEVDSDSESESESGEQDEDVEMGGDVEVDDSDREIGGVALVEADSDDDSDVESNAEGSSDEESGSDEEAEAGLSKSAPAFDWTGASVGTATSSVARSKNRTGLTSTTENAAADNGGDPQSTADFERFVLAEPNSAALWIRYMAFYAQLGDIDQARAVAERALNTIHMRETEEKLNVWVGLLNLESGFGDDGSFKSVFGRAIQHNDSATIHHKAVSILIESGKLNAARELFLAMTRIRAASATPEFWINYATFLLSSCNDGTAARALLKRATQSVPERLHRQLTVNFATLEFKAAGGDPERGRTIFEGLVAAFPTRGDVWDSWLAVEKAAIAKTGTGQGSDKHRALQVGRVRDLLVRMSAVKMKKVRARKFFDTWIRWEDSQPGKRGKEVEKVKMRARDYVERMRLLKEEREKQEGSGEDEEEDDE